MNKRDGLIELLQQKKKNEGKIAYKVTECYPEESKNNSTQNSQKSPAGVTHARSIDAKCLIYRYG